MSITITEDIVSGARLTADVMGKVAQRRLYFAGTTNDSSGLNACFTAFDSVNGIRAPQYGTPHNNIPGLFCSNIDIRPLDDRSRGQFIGDYIYKVPDYGTLSTGVKIRISSSDQTVEYSVDKNGNPVLVEYDTFAIAGSSQVNQGSLPSLFNVVKLEIVKPRTILEFERLEFQCPLGKSIRNRQHTNSRAWQGGEPGTWLCRDLNGESQNGLSQYTVQYRFEYDPEGWGEDYIYRDPHTGISPTNCKRSKENNQGIFTYRPPAADFQLLNLPTLPLI